MKRLFLVTAALAIAAAALFAEGPAAEPAAGPAAYARLKTLQGDWEASTSMGKVHASYELIAGGTSLVERESGQDMPTMLTVYYLDGNRLLLTHYCMAGNQPRMEARSFNPATGEVSFQFLDATNLPAGAGHMHNATVRVADRDHLSSLWDFYQDGKLSRTEKFEYTRVK